MKILICSGAGLSAESGIPTFRSAGGLWENHSIDEVCNIRSYLKNYVRVHDFYDARRKQLAKVEPNGAHRKIAELSSKFDVINITTNVDDLLERAGCKNVIHLHGEITKIVLDHGGTNEVVDIGYTAVEPALLNDRYPVKPGVVMFGERAPQYQTLLNSVTDLTDGDIFIIVGSSETVVSFATEYVPMLRGNVNVMFVNVDTSLCEMVNRVTKRYVAIVPCTIATFFENIENYIPELRVEE